jgi:hypothetical protein
VNRMDDPMIVDAIRRMILEKENFIVVQGVTVVLVDADDGMDSVTEVKIDFQSSEL